MNIYAFADEADSAVDGQIKACIRNSLKGIELRNIDGENISDITIEKALEVKNKLDNNSLIAWSLGSPIGKISITDDFKPHIEKFKHTLKIAKSLDCKNIRIFSFYIPQEENADNYRNEVIDRLATLIDIAKPYGINLCHENEKGIFGDTPERCLEIFKALPQLKGIFDPANFVQCGVDSLKAWETLKEYIYYMHIKDARLSDCSIVPAGKGDGNIYEIAKEYMAKGGKHFTMEPHLAVFDGLSGLERQGEETKMAFSYPDNNTAFDVACQSFRGLFN